MSSHSTPAFVFPNISPPMLEPDLSNGNTTTNQGTRGPRHYDTHLDADLILKWVEYLPGNTDLLSILCKAVDESLGAKHLMSITFPSVADLQGWHDAREVSSEAEIAAFYRKTTGSVASQVASGLALEADPDDVWPSLFEFTTVSGGSRGGAIPDGFLTMNRLQLRTAKGQSGASGNRLIETLSDSHICNRTLAVWEFKNLDAGGFPVMEEIGRIATIDRLFHWTTCDSASTCTNSAQHYMPGSLHEVRVTGDRMGCDADCDALKVQPTEDDSKPESQPNLSQSQPESLDDFSQQDASHVDGAGLKARHILQQVWAQAVKHDTTYLVIHSGNYEYIGLRHRATQTLYLSQLIYPAKCADIGGYVKLHTGLYLSAIKDAESRAVKMHNAALEVPSKIPAAWTRNYTPIRARPPRRDKKDVESNDCGYEDIVAIFKSQDEITISNGPQANLKIFTHNALKFTKCSARQPLYSLYPNLLLTIRARHDFNCYTGELTGVPYEDVEANQANPPAQRVAIKVALAPRSQEKLRNEYHLYSTIAAVGDLGKPARGVLRSAYLFQGADTNGEILILIMPFAGVPYLDGRHSPQTRNTIKTQFRGILETLHSAGFAHRGIDHKKLLIDEDMRLTLIGFGDADEPMNDPADMRRGEMAIKRDKLALSNL
ncbi:hypothetical protein C8R46DRAFT_434921 [Mycena filopes]|nr:hypothetical protein C8R46DRAFT_434921 [Mycena filopes]